MSLSLPTSDQIPVYVQGILNLIGFLIASVIMWYAYFVKGRDKTVADANKPEQELHITPYDAKAFRVMCEDVSHLRETMDKIYVVMKHDSTENEIRRRVAEELARERQARKNQP